MAQCKRCKRHIKQRYAEETGLCYRCYKKSGHRNNNQEEHLEVDNNGYIRKGKNHSNLIHRQIAYKEIYLKNRDEYPLPFSKYVIHHKDGDKTNNSVNNLEIISSQHHNKLHKKGWKKNKNWSQKKHEANKKNFSQIRLILGDKLTGILILTFWVSLILSIVLGVMGETGYSRLVGYIAIITFILMSLFFVIGWIYNAIRNLF